jgi:uncharacterized protein YndB with AHSA1/START domain
MKNNYRPDPQLDLVLERLIDVPRKLVWDAWTRPEQMKKWFVPLPWTLADCEVDLKPGGVFRTVMRSPEGEEFSSAGCYLEIIDQEKLVWTDALSANYRPNANSFFTGVISLADQGSQTLYQAIAIHKDEADRKKHEEMGFHAGWSQCLDQLVAMIKNKS